MANDATRPFLTAAWRYLAILSFEVERTLLKPFVPRGTEIDTCDRRVLLSLVGFRFLNTRVRGLAIPFHINFDEVNLRFYVCREVRGELRRGVTFVREIVPRYAIARVARLIYNEPYVALPMRSEVPTTSGATDFGVRYAWKGADGWGHLALSAAGTPAMPDKSSTSSFITEHHWGYTRQRDGSTSEYRVDHPPWRIWIGSNAEVSGGDTELFGHALGEALSVPPHSALLAEGSSVSVYPAAGAV